VNLRTSIAAHLEDTLAALARLDQAAVARLVAAIQDTHERRGTIFVCGNGGSATTASHFAQDLAKSTAAGPEDDRRLRVLALTESVSSLTAWANDVGYEAVFEQQLRTLGRPGDLLIALSGSGASANVLKAVRYAHDSDISTFAVTGFDGGDLRRLARDTIHVETAEMEVAENAHLVVLHQVVCAVREWKRERNARSKTAVDAAP
jgi:D-sedoheptulose 7-phosphate isomerase